MANPDLNIIHTTPDERRFERPLVFIHGMFQGSWVWDNFMEHFANHGFECYAINLRGHNGSSRTRPFRFQSIRNYLDDLESLLSSIVTDPILIGHSMGGFIVQKYLENHDIPLGILLCPVPPEGVIRPTLKVLRRAPLRFLLANLTLNLNPVYSHKKLMKNLMFRDDIVSEVYDGLYDKMQNESYLAYFDMLVLRLVRTKKVHSPLIILGTELDGSISPDSVRRTAKKYGVEAVIYPGRGHGIMIEEGWEEVAEDIFGSIKEKMGY